MVGEKNVFLRGEVPEERTARHVGFSGDVVNRHGVEAALAEQPERSRFELGGGQRLAPLAQTGPQTVIAVGARL
ncbi:MAG TPA: hypothetical protein VG795_08640, partial [Acidimicrobiia bacterium]|nr:hypothetical protein [Acidimicrobiia bacterium]